ncbi:MAG: hypothetical protein ACK5KS_21545, partial [Planctomyces sp.]
SEQGSNSKHSTDARQPPNIIRFFRMTEHFQKNEMKGSVLRSDQKRKRSVHQGAFSHQTDSEC